MKYWPLEMQSLARLGPKPTTKVTTKMMKRTIVGAVLAIAANTVSAQELPVSDPISAKIFLELRSIQQLAGVIDPLLTVPGEAFRIIEGDFIALGALRIRLVGIDAPEVAQRCNRSDGGLWECAAKSEDRVREILRSAERVECFGNGRDPYGYYIASCTADGEDVGARLVEEGLAWPDEEQGYYLPEAARAQAGSLGIWQAETERPAEWRKQHN